MNGIELNRLGMQRRILRNLSLRLDSYQQPITKLITAELRDALRTGISTSGGTWLLLPKNYRIID
jgi:hypothetical protein